MGIPTDAKELFEKQVPATIQADPERARQVGAIFCFRVSGEGGGDWTVDLASEQPACTSGVSEKAECTVEIAHEDFKAMLADPQLGMQLYFQGKLKITGDPTLALKLQQFFSLAAG